MLGNVPPVSVTNFHSWNLTMLIFSWTLLILIGLVGAKAKLVNTYLRLLAMNIN